MGQLNQARQPMSLISEAYTMPQRISWAFNNTITQEHFDIG